MAMEMVIVMDSARIEKMGIVMVMEMVMVMVMAMVFMTVPCFLR